MSKNESARSERGEYTGPDLTVTWLEPLDPEIYTEERLDAMEAFSGYRPTHAGFHPNTVAWATQVAETDREARTRRIEAQPWLRINDGAPGFND